jgi:ribosomal protein S14
MRHINYKSKRDYEIKKSYFEYEKNVIFNKSTYNEFQIIPSFSYLFYKRFYKINNKLSKARIRCLFTGRYRGTMCFFMMSRMYFKKLALNG